MVFESVAGILFCKQPVCSEFDRWLYGKLAVRLGELAAGAEILHTTDADAGLGRLLDIQGSRSIKSLRLRFGGQIADRSRHKCRDESAENPEPCIANVSGEIEVRES